MNRFLTDESGATTVDWVVLTAAACTMGLSLVAIVSVGPQSLGEQTRVQLESVAVAAAVIGGPAAP